jgi:uncharacterized protein (DUF934 family)
MAEVYTKSGFVVDVAPQPVALNDFLAAPGNSSYVILEPHSRLEALVPYLGQLAMIAVNFPKYTDGRGYSLAARLRLHYHYQGTLRGGGDVLTDQIQHFFRQGFDELVVTNEPTLARLKAGVFPAYKTFMQADILGNETAPAQGNAYSWRRSA